MLEAPLGASKSDPFMHPVVVLIPYVSIVSKFQSTGVNILQLSYSPSLFTGRVRFFCLASVRLGSSVKIQSVLQWYGKLMPVNTWPITSKATKMLGMHKAATTRFWNNPNSPISFRTCLKLVMLISECAQSGREKIRLRATSSHSQSTWLWSCELMFACFYESHQVADKPTMEQLKYDLTVYHRLKSSCSDPKPTCVCRSNWKCRL